MNITIDMVFLLISVAAGFFTFFQPATAIYLKILAFYLLASLINETTATVMIGKGYHTVMLYNFFIVIEFTSFGVVLSHIVQSKKVKKIIQISLCVYLFLALTNLFFIQKVNTFNSISFALGCLFVVAFSIYYFFELFQFPYAVKLVTEPAFWICTALLFYFCCIFPLIASVNFMSRIPALIVQNYSKLVALINVLLYSLFTVAFLCRIRVPKLIS